MVIILSAPATSKDAVRAIQNRPRPMEWVGFDGSRWDLTGIDTALVMQGGVRGLHNPKYVKYSSSSPAVPGRRIRGARALERDVFWPILFQADSVSDWHKAYRGFFDSFDPVKTGEWRVGTGDDMRVLDLVGEFGDDYAFDFDPFTFGWASIGVSFEAQQPYWRGQPIPRGPWKTSDSRPFIPVGGGPPYYVSSSSTFVTASMPNPGHVPAYLEWTAVGPLESISMGVGGSVIVPPMDLAAGSTLIVNTDPREQYATLDGADVTKEMGFQAFAPVQPATEAPLTVQAVGAGEISATLTPLYRRAF